MLNFFHYRRSSKANSRDFDFFPRVYHKQSEQPRNSMDAKLIHPLVDEEGTDERRYYRSAEFQQALLEDQIERSLTSPIERAEPLQETGRLERRMSRLLLHRRSTAASLPFPDQDMERAQVDENKDIDKPAEEEVPPSAYNMDDVPSTTHGPDSGALSSDGSGSEPSRSSSRPKVRRNSISPLIDFVRGKKE